MNYIYCNLGNVLEEKGYSEESFASYILKNYQDEISITSYEIIWRKIHELCINNISEYSVKLLNIIITVLNCKISDILKISDINIIGNFVNKSIGEYYTYTDDYYGVWIKNIYFNISVFPIINESDKWFRISWRYDNHNLSESLYNHQARISIYNPKYIEALDSTMILNSEEKDTLIKILNETNNNGITNWKEIIRTINDVQMEFFPDTWKMIPEDLQMPNYKELKEE